MATVRCKITVNHVLMHESGAPSGGGFEEIRAQAVYSPDPNHENKAFWDATPAFRLEMSITNPNAHGFFVAGHEYYCDFTRAD